MTVGPVSRAGLRGWAHPEGHAHGTFETFDAFDPGGGFPARKLHVFLPRDWEHAGRRYPVVYLHDGDAVFWRGGSVGKSWDAAGVVERLREAGKVPPMVLVAIRPGDRNAEYTHADWAHGERSYGRLPSFADAVADNVKGFIDAAYPTDPAPAATAVVGSSHGGLAAFWMATARPDRFGAAAALSPSFFTGIDSLVHGAAPSTLEGSALLAMAHATLADPARRPRFWLSWGARRDGGEHNAVVEALAARRGAEMSRLLVERYGYRRHEHGPSSPPADADLHVWEDPHGGHDEGAWSWQLGLALQALFPGDGARAGAAPG